MDVIGKLLLDTKRLSQQEDESKLELSQLKNDLLAEEKNYDLIKKDCDFISHELASLEQALNSSRHQIELVKSFREIYRTSNVLHSLLKKFIEKTEPNREQQVEELVKLKTSYTKLLGHYEDGPQYKAILQEESNEAELSKLIYDKRQELMKLDTEKEL